MKITTLCYITCGERTLMLHRNKKENDENAGNTDSVFSGRKYAAFSVYAGGVREEETAAGGAAHLEL